MRIAIFIILFMVIVGIPIGGAIINGWDWQTNIWYILIGALALTVGIERYLSWRKYK